MAARLVDEVKSWDLYAQLNPRFSPHGSEKFRNFYPSLLAYSVCGSDPIYCVRCTVDPAGSYYGWLYSDSEANGSNRGELSMIFAWRQSVVMCFPYGPEVEERAGKGAIVCVHVERLELVRP